MRNYALVTGAYWADTIADGASRMLVLFYFYELGYSPLEVALLFVFYEVFGVITNLVGGFVAARFGLRTTLIGGLCTQLVALGMLAMAPASLLTVAYVMVAQALSGIAKDLTKMSSKSAVKLVVPDDAPGALYKWVAILTGSKNALKGVGFFLGALGLSVVGFRTSLALLAALVGSALVAVLTMMHGELGRPDAKAKFRQMFSHNRAVNLLAAARLFLFASRDVWFVVGLPVFFRTEHGWTFYEAGGFLAIWTIGYGIVQASAPRLLRRRLNQGTDPDGTTATRLAFALAAFPRAHRDRHRHQSEPCRVRRRRTARVRRHLRDELRRAQLPHPRLRRRRQGRHERRLLLHGQRRRAPRRHGPLGRAVPMARTPGVPVGVRRVRTRRRPALPHDAVQHHRQDAHNDPTLPRHRLARPSRPRTRERAPCRIRCSSRSSQNHPCIAG